MRRTKNEKLHIALATHSLDKSLTDYTVRLGVESCVVVAGVYALWRTETLNISIKVDTNCKPGELRHLGLEDPEATEFSVETDVNGIVWERFNTKHQAEEINAAWPETKYVPKT